MCNLVNELIDLNAPRYLFKYQPINEYSLQNLRTSQLWASHPSAFNDPHEFKFQQVGNNPNKNELDKLIDEIDSWKVLCFSEDPLNTLMWAHYADNHKGMCIGFLTETITHPINYSDKFPFVDFNIPDSRQRGIEILRIITTKYSAWNYEKERRMSFIPGTTSEVSYPGKLFLISFGLRTPKNEIEMVKSIITDPEIIFYKCEFVPGSFHLTHILA